MIVVKIHYFSFSCRRLAVTQPEEKLNEPLYINPGNEKSHP